MKRVMLTMIVALVLGGCLVHGYIHKHPWVDIGCPDVECHNCGTLNEDTCSCVCTDRYFGMFCEKERHLTRWPAGNYALLSSVFGCPEDETYGWHVGYVNMSIPDDTVTKQKWKMPHPPPYPATTADPHILGPYHHFSIQLNFCTRLDDASSSHSNESHRVTWPPGDYCVIMAADTCPEGFSAGSVMFGNYTSSWSHTDGTLPSVHITNGSVTMDYCCRADSIVDENNVTSELNLPSDYHFIMIKPNTSSCNPVTNMTVADELFRFVDDGDLFEVQGPFNMFSEEGPHKRLSMCYYATTAIRECYHELDYGFSYRGTMSTTAEGEECMNWYEAYDIFKPSKYYVGHFELNHCRTDSSYRDPIGPPGCFINSTSGGKFRRCAVPRCDFDHTLEMLGKYKPVYSTEVFSDKYPENAVDGNWNGEVFESERPMLKPWFQVDLEEMVEVHAILVRRRYVWFPENFRFPGVYVGKDRWDFINYGSLQCEDKLFPRRASWYLFYCKRPIVGQYVTIRNFDDPDADGLTGVYNRLEITEIVVYGRRNACIQRLGLMSGEIQDFQISGSRDDQQHIFDDARLLNPGPGWCAENYDNWKSPHLTVDLITPTVLHGLELQGYQVGTDMALVTHFTVEVALKDTQFTPYLDPTGNAKTFQVNSDGGPDMLRRFMFLEPVMGTAVRINITGYMEKPCLKLELLGCPKRVSRDLTCSNSSLFYGYDELRRYAFWMEWPYTWPTKDDQECMDACTNLTRCVSAYLNRGIDCSLLLDTRFNRHYSHWVVKNLPISYSIYVKMCITDIKSKSECGGVIDTPMALFSPSYPVYYGQLLSCVWEVRFPEGVYVDIEVIFIDLATPDTSASLRERGIFDMNPGTCVDVLTIDEIQITSDNMDTFYGASIVSRTSHVTIQLTSCARYSKTGARGFELNISRSELPACRSSTSDCIAACMDSAALIMSPGFPTPISLESCRWSIMGTPGQYIQLTFNVINIPSPIAECGESYVQVLDKTVYNVRTTSRVFCSNNRPLNYIRSSWHYLELLFVSGSTLPVDRFMAEYRLVDFVSDTAVDTREGCGDWLRYEDGCYELFPEEDGLTWLMAEQRCADEAGHLVSLQTQKEVNFIHQSLTETWANRTLGDSEVFIGLRKTGTDGLFENYMWTDGSPLTFSAWGEDQPDGLDNERCTFLRLSSIHSNTNWNDGACAYDKIRLFICEKAAEGNISADVTSLNRSETNRKNASAGLYQCGSGEYILTMYVCDGMIDCSDNSDEENCGPLCSGDYFECGDGQCIPAILTCDFFHDCEDESDEDYCSYAACTGAEWRCESGQCVDRDGRCDVKQDCLDGSDELFCDSCQETDAFQCFDQRCLARSRVCDGFHDCSGVFNEDEDAACTINTRPTCADWYSIGKRTNDSYLIDLGMSEPFTVECRFYEDAVGNVTVQTFVHHTLEASFSVRKQSVYLLPVYPSRDDQIHAILMAQTCHQPLTIACSYTVHEFFVTGRNGVTISTLDSNSTCLCPIVGRCDEQCACGVEKNEEWYATGDNFFAQDVGSITDHDFLPVVEISSDSIEGNFLPELRFKLGPLVCTEVYEQSESSSEMVCDNGKLVASSSRCVLDFDQFGEIVGCRDLSHLKNCGGFNCSESYLPCNGSSGYCIPLRLVCDGVNHCPSGQDELDCANNTCKGAYSCRRSDICIPLEDLNDGRNQCPYGDDDIMIGIVNDVISGNTTESLCPVGCQCDTVFKMTCRDGGSLVNITQTAFLRNMKILSLSQSNLELTQDFLEPFPTLSYLNMSMCNIKSLAAGQFIYTPNMLTLDIRHNNISVLLAKTFVGLHQLRELLIFGNPLRTIEPMAFVGLSAVTTLHLAEISVINLEIGIFEGLDKLYSLNLSYGKIESVSDHVFEPLEQLGVLDLTSNSIQKFSGDMFSGLSSLRHLLTDAYMFCCIRPAQVLPESCLPQKNEFSSCDDLMRNEILRAFLWIIGMAALLGNMFVFVVRFILERETLWRSNGIFISSLSIADFLMGVYLITIAVVDTMYRGEYIWNDNDWRNGIGCQISGILSTLGSEGSVLFLGFITLDRLLIVKYPFGHFRISPKRALAMCAIAWLLVLCLALAPFMDRGYFDVTFYSRSAVCLPLPLTREKPPGWQFSIGVFIVFNFLMFVLIASAQLMIYREIVASRGKIASQGRRKDLAVARNLFLVAATDFMCWFPVGLMGLLGLSGHVISGDVYAWIAVFVLPINSALNPFLYTLGSDFKKRASTFRSKKSLRNSKKGVSGMSTSTSVTDVFDSPLFVFGKQSQADEGFTTLEEVLNNRGLSLQEISYTALRLSQGLELLHRTELAIGCLSTAIVVVKETDEVISSVQIRCSPKKEVEEEHFKTDIMAYGALVKGLLRNRK